jgi:hypothetical protein
MADSITPPPELVQQWVAEIWHEGTPVRVALSDEHIAARAAQWGADQELEACVEWLEQNQGRWEIPASLRAARRPKPPTLKEQALEALERSSTHADGDRDTIRRALEALPND